MLRSFTGLPKSRCVDRFVRFSILYDVSQARANSALWLPSTERGEFRLSVAKHLSIRGEI